METTYLQLPDGRMFYYQTIEIKLNGKQQKIIPVKTEFSMSSQAKAKDEILTGIKADMLLPTVMCFCKPEIFISANKPLFTLDGRQIPSDFNPKEKMLVYLDKADNVQLLTRSDAEPFISTIVNCKSVEDAIAKISASAYVSQIPTKNDWTGYAGAKDMIAAAIKRFADKYHIQGTVAQAYFGVNVKGSVLQNIAIFGTQQISGARTEEQATTLLEAVAQAFGAKCAGQTRYLKGVNFSINKYGFAIVVKALNNIGGKEKLQVAAASCEDKASCLQDLLTNQITELLKLQPNQQVETMTQAS